MAINALNVCISKRRRDRNSIHTIQKMKWEHCICSAHYNEFISCSEHKHEKTEYNFQIYLEFLGMFCLLSFMCIYIFIYCLFFFFFFFVGVVHLFYVSLFILLMDIFVIFYGQMCERPPPPPRGRVDNCVCIKRWK